MIKKLFLTAFASVLVMPIIGETNEVYGISNEYVELTETQSFYRITKNLEEQSMAELDNNPDTKFEFTKGIGITNIDYVFAKNAKVKEIHFTSDTTQYQRVVLMRGSSVYWTSDFSKFEDGVIKLPSEIQIDTIKIQFNGAVGTEHSLSDFEVIGYGMDTVTKNLPKNLPDLIEPEQISDLIQNANGGFGDKGIPESIESVEEPAVEEEVSEGIEEEQIVEEITNEDESIIAEEVAPEIEETPINEETVEASPEIEEAVDPEITVPINEDPITEEEIVEEVALIEEETIIEEAVPVEEQPNVEEVVEDEIIQETVVEEAITEPIEEEAVIIESPITPEYPQVDRETALAGYEYIKDKTMMLNPSVFGSKKIYGQYNTNAVSLKLMTHNKYDEAFLLEKLAYSVIHFNGKVLSIEEFIAYLKTGNFTK